MNIFKKILLEVINIMFGNRLAFFVAKKARLFDAVFVMYPATLMFADHYTFRWRQQRIAWRPWITGIIKHPSGKRTLQFAISATEAQLLSMDHADDMRSLYERTVRIQEMVGASTNHFAGIIPGRFLHLRVKRDKNELMATATNVVKAILALRREERHAKRNAVVILGARGYVGREVVKNLEGEKIPVVAVDIGDVYTKPIDRHIIVNITRPEGINEYISENYLDKSAIILNEVYPAPHPSIVSDIKALGAKVFHIAGVEAICIPKFPSAYVSAVPCCAALPTEEYKVVAVPL